MTKQRGLRTGNNVRPIERGREMGTLRRRALATAMALAWAGTAPAQPSEDEELALAYGDKSFVSIATGTRQPVTRAPAVATVITAADIEATGATDLDQVLETVPGLHVSRNHNSWAPRYLIRGIFSNFNTEVLMLVNGVPVTSNFLGDRGSAWGGLPLDNVARIEVVRGPGSALYGAEALAGVINIVTKTAAEIGGTQAGARAGSFGTWDAWVLHGGKLGPVDAAFYLRAGATDGHRESVRADAQTAFDTLVGTSASLAPGPVNVGHDALDAQLDLAWDKWRLRAGLKERMHIGTGAGVAAALDPRGESSNRRSTADLTWHDPKLADGWEASVQASLFHMVERSNLVLFPPGANIGTGVFADGMIGNPAKWERNGRLSAAANYTGFNNHRLRIGAGYDRLSIYKVVESKNFSPFFVPLGALVDVSDTAPFLTPHTRHVRYVYAQDEWSLARDWSLTAGVRHDHYSDFGNTTNPRLALVWESAYNLTSKLMYGRAFRAPSFTELYNINNPAVVGNPQLKPEIADTLELAFAWQASQQLQTKLNFFRIQRRDIIETGPVTRNAGRQRGQGMELEAVWDASHDVRLAAHYAYQKTIDPDTRADAGFAPHDHFYARADWRFQPGWTANAQLNWVANRQRAAGDTRPDVADYRTLDLTLRREKPLGGWDLSASVRNLFDTAAREPAIGAIPDDLPLPGRSFVFQARYAL